MPLVLSVWLVRVANQEDDWGTTLSWRSWEVIERFHLISTLSVCRGIPQARCSSHELWCTGHP